MSLDAREPTGPGTEAVLASLRRLGLVGPDERPRLEELAGGVSSDIWRVDLAAGPICVKRALEKLKVDADWRVPVDRNAHEVAWMRAADACVPGCVPPILGHDPEAGLFAMAFLEPARHPVWKEELHAGRADPDFAAEVGRRLGVIHAGTAGDPGIARDFANDALFHAIRLEPYLEATARAHPDLAPALLEIERRTAATKRALVHGDVSPKNILVGPSGPIFLDAECAWYGDPAFDLAFCLNHLLLKCLWTPAARPRFLECFDRLADQYLSLVSWEPTATLERRAARLLPGLFLARADGKSPAEYLTEADKARVRKAARGWLLDPPPSLSAIRGAWEKELAA